MNEEIKTKAFLPVTDFDGECSFSPPEEQKQKSSADLTDENSSFAEDRQIFYDEPAPLSSYVFDKDEKKKAKRIVSRTFLGVFFYWLIIQGVAAVIMLVAAVIAEKHYGEAGIAFVSSGTFTMLLQLVCYGVALPIFFAITKRIPRATTPKKNKLPFGQFMILVLIAWATMIIGSYVSSLVDLILTKMYGLPVNNVVDSMVSDTPLLLITLVAVIVGPIVEELIFRKVMIDRLSVFGDRTAIIISSIAFGLFHGNLSQLFYATLVGLVLGYVYSRTRKIWNSIFIHMIINFLGSVIPLIGQWASDNIMRLGDDMSVLSLEEQSLYSLSEALYLATSALQTGVFIAGLVFLIIYTVKRKFKVSHSCEMLIPRKERAGVYLANPGVILFIVICIISIATSLGMSILM